MASFRVHFEHLLVLYSLPSSWWHSVVRTVLHYGAAYHLHDSLRLLELLKWHYLRCVLKMVWEKCYRDSGKVTESLLDFQPSQLKPRLRVIDDADQKWEYEYMYIKGSPSENPFDFWNQCRIRPSLLLSDFEFRFSINDDSFYRFWLESENGSKVRMRGSNFEILDPN